TRKTIEETDEKIKAIQNDIQLPNKQTSPLDYQEIELLMKFKDSLNNQIKSNINHIKFLKEVIKEFTKKPEVMIEKYQAELGCS
ncbi:hypothetical protein, partial [uncultured Microscilla sp.]|uniref:hypothetical protein n=1 Tax=uncultured Microscilla sp. TaxID=432653 RepID=UPI00262F64F4